ncbi:MAG TPA: hypothetical protein VF443_03535 [Nitrospira sp.]
MSLDPVLAAERQDGSRTDNSAMYKQKWIWLFGAIVATGVLMTGVRFRAIAQLDNDAQLLWNPDQAVVLIGRTDLGWSFNAAQWVYEFIAGAAGTTSGHDQKRSSLVVITWHPGGSENHTVPDGVIGPVAAVNNEIYLLGGRWAGTHVEPLSTTESLHLADVQKTMNTSWPVQGWTLVRALLRQGVDEKRFSMEIGGERVTLVVKSSDPPSVQHSIAIEHEGHPTEALWSLDERTKWVGKSEYAEFFRH